VKSGVCTILLAAALVALTGAAMSGESYRLLQLEGEPVKWGAPELGTGASLTYAIIAGDETYSGVRNCPDTGNIDALLSRAGLSREDFEADVALAFARWEKVANLSFCRIEDSDRADIVIGAQGQPRGLGYADIARDEGTAALGSISKGLVCLNPELRWSAEDGIADVLAENARGGDALGHPLFDLAYTLTHEIGHLLGLDHPGARGTLMSFAYDSRVRDLQPGDVAGVIALYGPAVPPPARIASSDLLQAVHDGAGPSPGEDSPEAVLQPALRVLPPEGADNTGPAALSQPGL